MSYTNAQVTWQKRIKQDPFGDYTYADPVLVRARKQHKQTVIKTSDGRELLSEGTYYVEVGVEPNALQIAANDKLDGYSIEQRYVMSDLANEPVMIRLVVV